LPAKRSQEKRFDGGKTPEGREEEMVEGFQGGEANTKPQGHVLDGPSQKGRSTTRRNVNDLHDDVRSVDLEPWVWGTGTRVAGEAPDHRFVIGGGGNETVLEKKGLLWGENCWQSPPSIVRWEVFGKWGRGGGGEEERVG